MNISESIAPLGISYLMDVYHEKETVCKNVVEFSVYLTYFPKISQGPIVKYQDMIGEIRERKIEFNSFLYGVERFIVGLSKKVLIADILGQTVGDIFYSVGIGMDVFGAWLELFGMMIHPSYTYGTEGYVFGGMSYELPDEGFYDLFCAYLKKCRIIVKKEMYLFCTV